MIKKIFINNFKVLTEGFIIFLGVAIGTLINFFGLKLLTTVINTSTLGEVSLILSFVSFANMLGYGPINNAIGRYLLIAEEDSNFKAFNKTSTKLLLYISFGILFTFLISCFFLESFFLNIIISAFYAVFLGYSSYYNTIQNTLRERKTVLFINILDKTFKMLIPYFLIILFYDSTTLIFIGYLIGVCLVVIVQFFVFKNFTVNKLTIINKIENNNYKKELISFALPFFGWGIFEIFRFNSEKWVLAYFNDLSELGFYTVLNQIGFQSVTILTGIVTSLTSPILFKKASSSIIESIKLNNKLTYQYTFFLLIGFIFLYFYNHSILSLLVGKKFLKYDWLLPYFYLGGVFYNSAQMFCTNFNINLKPNLLIYPKIFTTILAIILNIGFVQKWGIIGLAWAQIISSFVYLLWVITQSNLYLTKIKHAI